MARIHLVSLASSGASAAGCCQLWQLAFPLTHEVGRFLHCVVFRHEKAQLAEALGVPHAIAGITHHGAEETIALQNRKLACCDGERLVRLYSGGQATTRPSFGLIVVESMLESESDELDEE